MSLRIYKGLSLNNIDPSDPAFGTALRSALNEIDLFLRGVNRELSPTQGGSTTSTGAANTNAYVVTAAASDLSDERILAASSPLGVSDGGAGANVTVALTGQVPVANGGTGAATAAAGRAALGADKVSVNGTEGVDVDLDDATPAAPAGGFNVKWQTDASSPMNASGYVTVATPALTFGSTSNAGSAASTIRSDAQISAFDGNTPTAIAPDNVAATGSVAKAARRDHVHGVTVDTPAVLLSSTYSDGVANSLMRSDSVIKAKSDTYFVCSTAQKGLVSKDTQGTPRYWALYVKEGATTPASGDCTINITSAGVITATRAGGAAGDITIVLKDLGTTIPF